MGVAAFGGWLAWCALAHAQGPEPVALTYEEALLRADAFAPEVAIAAAQASVARHEVDVAGILPDPRIGGGVSIDYAAILDLYVLLPIFGQLDTATDAARARAQLSADGIDVARLDARLAVGLAWIDLWLSERVALFGAGDAERRDRIEETARARFEEDAVARLDVVRAHADAARARAERDALDAARSASAARLAGTLGADSASLVLATEGAPVGGDATFAPSLDAIDDILASHPVAVRAAASLHAADEAVRHEHRSRWPRLGVGVSDWIHRANDAHDVRLLLTMELPLFDEPRIARSEALEEQSRIERDATLVRLRASLIAARADYLASVARCRAQETDVLPAAREAAELALEGYREGSIDLSTTLVTAQALADAERALAVCWADRARTAARLSHAEGHVDAH